MKMLEMLSQKLRRTTEKLEARIAKTLLALAETAGTVRESVNRQLDVEALRGCVRG